MNLDHLDTRDLKILAGPDSPLGAAAQAHAAAALKQRGCSVRELPYVPAEGGVLELDCVLSKNRIHTVARHRKTGKLIVVLTTEARHVRKRMKLQAKEQWVGPPLAGPVSLSLTVLNPRLDAHNAEELLFDALEGICYENDRHIEDHHTYRARGSKKSGLIVRIRPIQPTA